MVPFSYLTAELGDKLLSYVERTWPDGIVKVLRTNERSGLIRAKLTGAMAATGDVLIFLDAHCEVNQRWYVINISIFLLYCPYECTYVEGILGFSSYSTTPVAFLILLISTNCQFWQIKITVLKLKLEVSLRKGEVDALYNCMCNYWLNLIPIQKLFPF